MDTFFFIIKNRSFFVTNNNKNILYMLYSRKGSVPANFDIIGTNIVDHSDKQIKLTLINVQNVKKIVFKKKTKGSRGILSSSKEVIAQYKVQL